MCSSRFRGVFGGMTNLVVSSVSTVVGLVAAMGLVGSAVVRLALVLDVGHVSLVAVDGVVDGLHTSVGKVDVVGAGGVLAVALLVVSKVGLVVVVLDLVAVGVVGGVVVVAAAVAVSAAVAAVMAAAAVMLAVAVVSGGQAQDGSQENQGELETKVHCSVIIFFKKLIHCNTKDAGSAVLVQYRHSVVQWYITIYTKTRYK